MREANRYWQLFVDESGDFRDPAEAVVLAGLALRTYDTTEFRLALQDDLASAFPCVPYPPHAAHLRVPGYLVACFLAHPEGFSEPGLRRLCDRAATLARESSHSAAVNFVRAIPKARPISRIPIGVTRAFDSWLLHAHPAVHGGLARWTTGYASAAGEMLQRIAGRHEGFVVAAWQSPGLGAEDCDRRHDDLMEVLLERTAQVLASNEPPDDLVWLRIASPRHDYDVATPRIAAERALRFPLGHQAACEHVQFLPAMPAFYDERVHAGLVLADLIANKLRFALGQNQSWNQLGTWAADSVMFPIDVFARALRRESTLPTLAADGTARQAIRQAFEGEDLQALYPRVAQCSPRWTGHQASAWLGASQRRGSAS